MLFLLSLLLFLIPSNTDFVQSKPDKSSGAVRIDDDNILLKDYQEKLAQLVAEAESKTKQRSDLDFLNEDKYRKLASLVSEGDETGEKKKTVLRLGRNKYNRLLDLMSEQEQPEQEQSHKETDNLEQESALQHAKGKYNKLLGRADEETRLATDTADTKDEARDHLKAKTQMNDERGSLQVQANALTNPKNKEVNSGKIKIDRSNSELNSRLAKLLRAQNTDNNSRLNFLGKKKHSRLADLVTGEEEGGKSVRLGRNKYEKLAQLLAEVEELEREQGGAQRTATQPPPINTENLWDADQFTAADDRRNEQEPPGKAEKIHNVPVSEPYTVLPDQLTDEWLPTNNNNVKTAAFPDMSGGLAGKFSEDPNTGDSSSLPNLVGEMKYLKESLAKLEDLMNSSTEIGRKSDTIHADMVEEMEYLSNTLVNLEKVIQETDQTGTERNANYEHISEEMQYLKDEITNLGAIIAVLLERDQVPDNNKIHQTISAELEILEGKLLGLEDKQSKANNDRNVTAELEDLEETVVKLEGIMIRNAKQSSVPRDAMMREIRGIQLRLAKLEVKHNIERESADTDESDRGPAPVLTSKLPPLKAKHAELSPRHPDQSAETHAPKRLGTKLSLPESKVDEGESKTKLEKEFDRNSAGDEEKVSRDEEKMSGDEKVSGDQGISATLDEEKTENNKNIFVRSWASSIKNLSTTDYLTLSISILALLCVLMFMFFVTTQWKRVQKILKYDKIRSRESIRSLQEEHRRLISDSSILGIDYFLKARNSSDLPGSEISDNESTDPSTASSGTKPE